MRRRSLLAALAAGLAGCGGSGGGRRETFGVPSTTPPTATEGPGDPTTTAPDLPQGIEPTRDVTVPADLRRAVTARMGRPRRLVIAGGLLSIVRSGGRLVAGFLEPPTGGSPARVWMAFTNDVAETREFGFGPTPPFSQYWARPEGDDDEPRAFLLVPDDDRRFPYEDLIPEEPTDGRWVATDRLGTPTGPVDSTRVALSPGESIVGTYRLLVHPAATIGDRGYYLFEGAPWTGTRLGLADYRATLEDPGDSRFGLDRGVPGLPSTPGTRWYHEVAAAESPPGTFLRPEWERFPIGEGSVEVGIENYEPYTVPVGGWRLYKRDEGRWRRVTPWDTPDPAGTEEAEEPTRVPPGGRVAGEFVPRRRVRRDRGGLAVPGLRVGGLGGGLYVLAFGPAHVGGPGPEAPAVVDSDPEPGAGGPIRVALAALLELTGDPATVTPTPDVASVEPEGPTVTVRVEKKFGPDPVEGPELVVERIPEGGAAGDARDAGRLLTEQVNQFAALRNALVHFEDGVETVRVVTDGVRVDRPLAALGTTGNPLVFRFSGETYEARPADVVGGSNATTEG